MLPPVRCFTCGKVIADLYDYYVDEVEKLKKQNSDKEEKAAAKAKPSTSKKAKEEERQRHEQRHFDSLCSGKIMDKLGLKRYCCRRMMLGIADMMDTI